MHRANLIRAIFLAIFFLGFGPPDSSVASHLRAAQLTWKKTATNTAEFEATLSARRDFYSPLPVVGSTISGPTLSFGDDLSQVVIFTVEAVDVANDVIFAETKVSHGYASAGPFTAALTDCCRLST